MCFIFYVSFGNSGSFLQAGLESTDISVTQIESIYNSKNIKDFNKIEPLPDWNTNGFFVFIKMFIKCREISFKYFEFLSLMTKHIWIIWFQKR